MNHWEKLARTDVAHKQKYADVFRSLIKQVQDKEYMVSVGQEECSDYVIVTELLPRFGYILSIVPLELKGLFQDVRQQAPEELIGYSVFVKTYGGRDVRVICFGVPCDVLAKSLIKRKS
jgi:hypothetical protein